MFLVYLPLFPILQILPIHRDCTSARTLLIVSFSYFFNCPCVIPIIVAPSSSFYGLNLSWKPVGLAMNWRPVFVSSEVLLASQGAGDIGQSAVKQHKNRRGKTLSSLTITRILIYRLILVETPSPFSPLSHPFLPLFYSLQKVNGLCKTK